MADFGKCAICGDDVTIRDASGEDHCRQGHVYATGHAEHPFGPVRLADIAELLKVPVESTVVVVDGAKQTTTFTARIPE